MHGFSFLTLRWYIIDQLQAETNRTEWCSSLGQNSSKALVCPCHCPCTEYDTCEVLHIIRSAPSLINCCCFAQCHLRWKSEKCSPPLFQGFPPREVASIVPIHSEVLNRAKGRYGRPPAPNTGLCGQHVAFHFRDLMTKLSNFPSPILQLGMSLFALRLHSAWSSLMEQGLEAG